MLKGVIIKFEIAYEDIMNPIVDLETPLFSAMLGNKGATKEYPVPDIIFTTIRRIVVLSIGIFFNSYDYFDNDLSILSQKLFDI